MSMSDVLGRTVQGPRGPMTVSAMYAAVSPEFGEPARSHPGRCMGEVIDGEGGRYTALVEDGRARLLGPGV